MRRHKKFSYMSGLRPFYTKENYGVSHNLLEDYYIWLTKSSVLRGPIKGLPSSPGGPSLINSGSINLRGLEQL